MNNSKNNLRELLGLRKVTEGEQKKILVDILSKIHSFCVEMELNIVLLMEPVSAVRHKGFIPRDDDVDIVMTREL